MTSTRAAAKPLNAISHEGLVKIETTELEYAAWALERGQGGRAAEYVLNSAQASHALARPLEEIRARLEAAARGFSAAAAAGNFEETVPYDFWRIHSLCTWAGCAEPLARLPRELWSDEDGSATPGLREVIDLLLAEDRAASTHQGGEADPADDITAALGALASRTWKQPFATRVSQPLAALHHALRVGDSDAFQAALAGVVDGHLYMVRGEMRMSAGGLMCVGLLGPLQVAARRGLEFKLDTPYLPRGLIDMTRGADAPMPSTSVPQVSTRERGEGAPAHVSAAPVIAAPAQRVDISVLKMKRDEVLVSEERELAAAKWYESDAGARAAADTRRPRQGKAKSSQRTRDDASSNGLVEAAHAWMNAAQLGFVLGRSLMDVRTRLREGARVFAAAAVGHVSPGMMGTFVFWRFLSVCSWAGCAEPLRRIPREIWCHDEAATPGLSEVLDLLLAEEDEASTAELARLAARRWKEPWAKRIASPLASLHHALRVRDAVALQAAFDASLEGHRYLTRTVLKQSPDGLMCLGLLGPLHTAEQRGLKVQLDSPYLPIELVRS